MFLLWWIRYNITGERSLYQENTVKVFPLQGSKLSLSCYNKSRLLAASLICNIEWGEGRHLLTKTTYTLGHFLGRKLFVSLRYAFSLSSTTLIFCLTKKTFQTVEMQNGSTKITLLFNYSCRAPFPTGPFSLPSKFHFLREPFLHFYISLLVAIVVRLWRYDWVVCTRKRKPLFTLLFPNKMDVQKLPPFTSFLLPKYAFPTPIFPLEKWKRRKSAIAKES